MSDPASYGLLPFLLGGGGLAGVLIAFFGMFKWQPRDQKSAAPTSATPAAVPIQVESPWLVQTLLEIKMDVEGLKDHQAATVKTVSELSVQQSTLIGLLRGRRRRRRRN